MVHIKNVRNTIRYPHDSSLRFAQLEAYMSVIVMENGRARVGLVSCVRTNRVPYVEQRHSVLRSLTNTWS